jgi:5-methylcytosine-specific restriction endonuclease McrA
MTISLPVTTLVIVLAVIIVLGFLLRLINIRRGYRNERIPESQRTARRGSGRAAAPVAERERVAPHEPGKGHAAHPGTEHGHVAHPVPEKGDKGAEVAQKYGLARSPEWPAVAREHLLHEPACTVCGHEGEGLQVHHIKPFHLFPQLELDPNNLITLCEIRGRDHHLLLGHLDDWESYNLNVREDVKRFHKENALQIKANPAWQAEEQRRPNPRV